MSTSEPVAGFRPTLWTVVHRAKDTDAPDRPDTLERLLKTYWKPI